MTKIIHYMTNKIDTFHIHIHKLILVSFNEVWDLIFIDDFFAEFWNKIPDDCKGWRKFLEWKHINSIN